jgi:hypothetical protein
MFKVSKFSHQVHLVIWSHPHHYPNGPTQVSFVDTLLLNTILAWFACLLECQSPLLNYFEAFVEEFNVTFGDLNKKHTLINKLQSIH